MNRPRLIADGDSLLNYNVAVSGVVQLYSCCYQFKFQICLTYPCAIRLAFLKANVPVRKQERKGTTN